MVNAPYTVQTSLPSNTSRMGFNWRLAAAITVNVGIWAGIVQLVSIAVS